MATYNLTAAQLRGTNGEGILNSFEIPSSGGGGFTNLYSTQYDGVDDYIEVTPYSTIDSATSFSISFWIKPTASVARSCFFIDGTHPIQFICRANSGAEYIDMSISTTSYFARSSVGSVPLNQWTHIVWTYDGSQTRYNRYKLYINGQSDLASSNGSNLASLGTYTKLWIGKQNSLEFTGFFDEFAIYKNTILSQANADAIYNGGTPNDLNNNGLTAPTNWWRFEEGMGTTAIDSGTGGDNGTLNNGVVYSSDVPT